MKILITETEPWEKTFFEGALKQHEVQFWPSPLLEDNLPQQREAEIISPFVNSRLSAKVLEAFPNLKLIATRSTGFDHIDLAASKARGITVSTVPSYGEHTVAEYSFALLLEVTRKIGLAYDRVRQAGMFTTNETMRGTDLHGKTLAIIGTGRIGRNVASIAKGFGMKVICSDKYPSQELIDKGYSYHDFDELLPYADVITFHVPALPETTHMLNHERMAKLKKGVIIINTSRGQVIDTNALIWGLKQGIVTGAGLDVLEEEGALKHDAELSLLVNEHLNPDQLRTVLADQYLIDHPSVIITPHNAFNTQEALQRIAQTTLDNITGFIANSPQNVVEAS